MNRNTTEQLIDIANILSKNNNSKQIIDFMLEIFTPAELEALSKRWQILKMLYNGKTQRDIANELQVSLCKVTRGSKIIKKKNSVTLKYLKGDI